MEDNKVAVLIEDLMAKFNTFGDGLNGLREELQKFREEINNRFDKLEIQNRQEHYQLMQLIKQTDIEVQELKRIK